MNTEQILKVLKNERECIKRQPVSWELWQVIKGTPLNKVVYDNYTAINDYTCDIDEPEDIAYFDRILKGETK